MITTAILTLFFTLLDGLLSLLYNNFADVTVDSHVLTAITTVTAYYNTLDGFIPLTHIFLCLLGFAFIEIGLAIYKAVRWSYRKFPGIT